MSNNVYADTANDSWINRVRERLDYLQRLVHNTDFTCPIQVQKYNEAVQSIKVTVPMIQAIVLEKEDE